jgi:hypothetical protein
MVAIKNRDLEREHDYDYQHEVADFALVATICSRPICVTVARVKLGFQPYFELKGAPRLLDSSRPRRAAALLL